MNKCLERLQNGIIKENPTFVLMLGMCPTLAVTSSLMNGLGMGLTTTVVLTASNCIISLLRKIIPDKVRMPAFIVIVASFVTMVQFLLQAYLPALNDSLGIYIPLIVVNCIILGRAESYASKNPVLPSIFDGIGMGLGFTIGLSSIGFFRELIGTGAVLSHQIINPDYSIGIIALAPGAFFVLAMLVAVQNKVKLSKGMKVKEETCGMDCSKCSKECDSKNAALDNKALEDEPRTDLAEVKARIKQAIKNDKEAIQKESERLNSEKKDDKEEA